MFVIIQLIDLESIGSHLKGDIPYINLSREGSTPHSCLRKKDDRKTPMFLSFRYIHQSVLKVSLIALVLILISLQTDGSCPNNCNGHGECSPYSPTRGWGTVNNGSATCECQANYWGADCSLSKSSVYHIVHLLISILCAFCKIKLILIHYVGGNLIRSMSSGYSICRQSIFLKCST